MPIFHVAPFGHNVGDTIPTGTFGDYLSLAAGRTEDASCRFYAEAVFEIARRSFAPSKPSRLECVFCFDTDRMAVHFLRNERPAWQIYEIEILVPTLSMHFGDFALIRNPAPSRPMSELLERVRHYWRGDHSGSSTRELLTSSPVQVLRGPLRPT